MASQAVVYRVIRAGLAAISVEPKGPVDTELFVVVDPETELPARITLSLVRREEPDQKAWFIWDEFQWGKPLDAGLFKLDVPEGYQIVEGPPPQGPLWPDLEKMIGAEQPPEK